MFKRTVLAVSCLSWLSVAAPVAAQEPATLVLTSGERISGELVDLGGVGFTMTVNGQQRQIPTNDVAAIEFTGGQPSSDVTSRLNAGQQVVVLKSGQLIEGHLYDIGGTRPLRITVDTSSGRRDLNSGDIAQVYLAAPRGSSSSSAVATTGANGSNVFAIPANQQWTSTNITVREGDRVNFTTSGQIRYTPNPNDVAPPAGAGAQKIFGRRATAGGNDPLPSAPKGALIGKIDDGQPFLVGSNRTVRMPASGTLYLGVNDDGPSDNGGEFRVVIGR
jgi:hypothetical protein